MRIAIFSDLHGNLIGTKEVLSHIRQNGGSDMIIAAGDIVGGSSGTEDLIDLLIQNEVIMLKGNGEELYTAYNEHIDKTPSESRDFFQRTDKWLHSMISDSYWDLLKKLPINITINLNEEDLLVCHAAPDNPWGNACTPYADEKNLESDYGNVHHKIIAFGHFHSCHIMTYRQKILVNVASVGLRTDSVTCYTLLESIGKKTMIKQFMLPYDDKQEKKINLQYKVPIPENL